MNQKAKSFLLSNQILRKIRNFFHQTFFPLFAKIALALLTLLVLTLISLKLFKPNYFDKIYKRSALHLLHYLHLDNQEFSEINISGNIHTGREQVVEIVKSTQKKLIGDYSDSYQPLINKLVEEIKSQLPWIHQITITRSMPDTLNISIVEYKPIAIWQNGDEKYLSDKDGNLVPFEDLEEFKHLVILSGLNANTKARSLFNIFTINPELSSTIYSATWVSNRRWDIRFENGLLVKLPESDLSGAWQKLIKIYNMPGSIVGLKLIDLRVADKVYLEYDDSVIKELKDL